MVNDLSSRQERVVILAGAAYIAGRRAVVDTDWCVPSVEPEGQAPELELRVFPPGGFNV